MLLTKPNPSLLLSLCLTSALLFPAISQGNTDMLLAAAETETETGSIAASKAADQKEALAKKAADRQKAAEAKKATQTEQPAVEQKDQQPTK